MTHLSALLLVLLNADPLMTQVTLEPRVLPERRDEYDRGYRAVTFSPDSATLTATLYSSRPGGPNITSRAIETVSLSRYDLTATPISFRRDSLGDVLLPPSRWKTDPHRPIFVPDGPTVVLVPVVPERPKDLTFVDATTLVPWKVFTSNLGMVPVAVVQSDDQRVLAVASFGEDSGEVDVWDLQTGERLLALTPEDRCYFSVDLSPDGRLLVASGYTGARMHKNFFEVWNVETGAQVLDQVGGPYEFWTVAIWDEVVVVGGVLNSSTPAAERGG